MVVEGTMYFVQTRHGVSLHERLIPMIRVPVLSPDGEPLMPAKASRVRRWLKAGKAKVVHNDLNLFQVQLVEEPSGKKTQDILTGIDPGKLFTGVAVQSRCATLFLAHLKLVFKNVTKRMSQRAMMRRGRRGRRINRKVPFNQRNHRECRFDNRKGHKIPPSIRANKRYTSNLRKYLGLPKSKNKAEESPATGLGRAIMSRLKKRVSPTKVTFPVTPKPKFR